MTVSQRVLFLAAAWLAVLPCLPASAHFVFVVPDDRGLTASLVFSESLDPDPDVDDAPLRTMVVRGTGGDGRATPLVVRDRGTACGIDLPGGVTQVGGRLDYGVMSRGGAEPFLLVYHPRAILGDPFAAAGPRDGDHLPRIVPSGRPGAVRFVVEAAGRPVAETDVTVILPDGSQEKVKTGADGATNAFAPLGRYGAWTRYVEDARGEHDGKPYATVRHYPTIVCTITEPTADAARSEQQQPVMRRPDPATLSPTSLLPPLPEAASSLGAVASPGFLYVYGGHIAPVHTYSTEAVSGRFHRLAIPAADASGASAVTRATWEELAGGPRLQGMNLAAHGDRIYRAGGMDPRNAPGDEADNFSIAAAACFDPAEGRWINLPPLPEPRSSHDLVVLGDTLYAVGGWNMLGADGGEQWCETMAALDLAAATPEWRSLPQPFTRRALIAAAYRDRLWVIGGFTDVEEVSRQVDIYDPRTGTWSRGPDLPEGGFNGFAPAACVANGRLLVSVADGSLLALDDEAGAWQTVAQLSPRIVHRMVPTQGGVILVGGAAGKDNLDRVERVAVP